MILMVVSYDYNEFFKVRLINQVYIVVLIEKKYVVKSDV